MKPIDSSVHVPVVVLFVVTVLMVLVAGVVAVATVGSISLWPLRSVVTVGSGLMDAIPT